MSVPCEIIKDLMPLYQEDLCNEQTKQHVEEHLTNCQSCEAVFNEMNENIFVVNERKDEKVDDVAVNVLKKINHKMKKTNLLIGIASFGIAIVMLYMVTLFNNLNHYFIFVFFFMVISIPGYLLIRNGFLYKKNQGNLKEYYKLRGLKEITLAAFILYSIPVILILLRSVFLYQWIERPMLSRLNLIPFNGIVTYLQNPEFFNTDIIIRNTLGKILAFVPYGILAPLIWKNLRYKKMTLIFIITIIIFQFIRLMFGGIADIDTIILNVIGLTLGYNIINSIKNKVNSTKLSE